MSEKSARILNVNDRDIPRYINEEILRRGGFDVVSVANGADALRAARDVDVVLLDVQLPDVDGYEVCRQLKANPDTANTIVLLTSATFVTSSNKITGLDAGADGYLVQPYESAELFATLRALIRTRVAERRAQALADELTDAMKARDNFLAMLGHELRNPLASITTAVDLMQRTSDLATSERYLDIISRQSANLARIVDDLLDVARVSRGKISLDKKLLDLRTVVERCVQSVQEDAHKANHTIDLSLPSAEMLVVGDVVRLDQIVTNLLTNAIKYTPNGGRIGVTLTSANGTIALEVNDNGIGMSPKLLSQIFDVFVQNTQSIDRSRGGLGLGLSVVRQLVELHGGTVTARSAGEGHGSALTVTLPCAPAGSTLTTASDEAPTCVPMHVVVVEDNEDARLTLQDALVDMGHRVETANDGLSGMALIQESKPDIALIDIGLPVIDGYEIARRLRSQAAPHLPRLVAMTGYGLAEDRELACDAGFDMHLVKPVSLTNLQRIFAALRTDRSD